jgi:hypothetical protein
MTQEGPPEWEKFGVTLEIPGPVVPIPKAQEVFKDFQRRIGEREVCGIWRVEIQGRGMYHWHLILWVSPDEEIAEFLVPEIWARSVRKLGWAEAWYAPGRDKYKNGVNCRYTVRHIMPESRYLSIGPERIVAPGEVAPGCYEEQPELLQNPNPGERLQTIVLCDRMEWPGAKDRAVKFDHVRTVKGSLLRYLCDHTSKRKQDQIVPIGRHWGKINAKYLRRVLPDRVVECSDAEYYRARRWFADLVRAARIKPGEFLPWGQSKWRRDRRGCWGDDLRFSENYPEMERMLAHSKGLTAWLAENHPEWRKGRSM